ncbi:helix-turn-helix transcriptional regulator [Pseudoalteromonas sp. S1727]|uniref:helix-turn-helix transcriptional regulator n=1 Tax=Pseudoalteromonas sp. S1727 TaxID=2066514 RepID=UPI001108A31D|nr:helix-turn-helix transcriptional regulator [Pseudoalteromonas sp. S1727]
MAANMFICSFGVLVLKGIKVERVHSYYAVFFLTVIFYLYGPLLNALPIEGARPYIHLGRTVLLFSLGIPSLFVALFMRTGCFLAKPIPCLVYLFGIVWSVIYFVLSDLTHPKTQVLADFGMTVIPFEWLVRNHVYYLQIIAILILMILPCVYLLLCKKTNVSVLEIKTVLGLACVMIAGNAYQNWVLYYLGTSVFAAILGWSILKDIQISKADVEDPAVTKQHLDDHVDVEDKTYPFIPQATLQNSLVSSASTLNSAHCPSSIQSNLNSEMVENAKQYVLLHFSKNINIDIIAVEIGVSRSNLIKHFKQLTGNTINNYITDVRIERAKQLLITQSITATAYEVGFNNSNYFTTVFKKKTNITPKQFQKNHTQALF